MPKLTYQADGHRYFIDDNLVPGVTGALDESNMTNFKGPEGVRGRAMERGSIIHKACQRFDEEECEVSEVLATLPHDYHGRFISYVSFKKTTGFVPTMIEMMVYSATHWYGGRPDRVGTMNGIDGLVLVDIKNGPPDRSAGLQLAGYAYALWEMDGVQVVLRIVVELKDSGIPEIHRYLDDLGDRTSFFNGLGVTQWIWNNGGRPS